MTDRGVADKIGCSNALVCDRRNELKIPHFVPKSREWIREEDALLGTMHDKEVADKIGRSQNLVTLRRRFMNIPPYLFASRKFTPEFVAMLGTMSDRALAEKIGYSRNKVRKERVIRNIPAFLPKKYYNWTKKTLKLLGTTPDEYIAEILEIPLSTVGNKRRSLTIAKYGKLPRSNFPWEEWEKEKCRDIVSAEKVAKAIGRTVQSVRAMRSKLGLDYKTGIDKSNNLRTIDD